MLDFLAACHAGQVHPHATDAVMALDGTRLIVAQQNISRRVSMEQYRAVLQAACAGRVAKVLPLEPGTRAEEGTAGLRQDVAPSLVWGRDHVPELRRRVAELRDVPQIASAVALARKYLREPVPLEPKFYLVMGGRAGAATIGDELYFDVLITSWRAAQGVSEPMSNADVAEFFAHETHHLGYGQILDRKLSSLHLNYGERQAWSLLTAVLMEGSASLLINGHERIGDLEQRKDFQPYFAKVPELLPAMQNVLQQALNGNLSNERFEQQTALFLGMGYHGVGAALLSAIEQKHGLAGVMKVMDDPRSLLRVFNQSGGLPRSGFHFDAALAVRAGTMGTGR
jgi:hypothetical protein